MIIVKLMGGLGNQMFQYAAGRSLSNRLGLPILMDHSFLETDPKGTYTPRRYELEIFEVKCKTAGSELLKTIPSSPAFQNANFIQKLFKKSNFATFPENGFNYHPEFENLNSPTYLSGFWQSEKYFSAIRTSLLQDFNLKVALSSAASINFEKIRGAEHSVAVHVRRGDYVSSLSANQYHGLPAKDYYLKAINILSSQFPSIHFFFFSDDMNWTEANFNYENFHFIKGLKNYEDLELMKHCHHIITANSSFSWWAAWLNTNEHKIVICPKNWFSNHEINTADLIPNEWQRL